MFYGASWTGRELWTSRIQERAAQVSGVPIRSSKPPKWFSQRHSLQAALMTSSKSWQDCGNGGQSINARKGARKKPSNYAGRSKGQERTTKGCNSKDLSTVNALHGRFALCRWLRQERMWFSSCEDCNQPLKGLEADQRGLRLLALLSLCVQQQAGCCATGTGESHSSCTKATWASFVFMLT